MASETFTSFKKIFEAKNDFYRMSKNLEPKIKNLGIDRKDFEIFPSKVDMKISFDNVKDRDTFYKWVNDVEYFSPDKVKLGKGNNGVTAVILG